MLLDIQLRLIIDLSLHLFEKECSKQRAYAEPHILWIVGNGDLDAYRDRWCQANITFFFEHLILNSVFNYDGMLVEESFRNMLGHEALEEAINKNVSFSDSHKTTLEDFNLNALPTDHAASKKVIYRPSKCLCCLSSSVEFNNHLFLTSETASYIFGTSLLI